MTILLIAAIKHSKPIMILSPRYIVISSQGLFEYGVTNFMFDYSHFNKLKNTKLNGYSISSLNSF